MKILITGHRGFVGQNFWRALSDKHELHGIDLKDGFDARNLFKVDETRFDMVIHLAAIVGGRMQIEGSPLSVAIDLSIDAEMFNWAVRTKPGRVVYFSSSAAYPIALQCPEWASDLGEEDIDLDDVQTPDMSYGWSKLTGELLARYAEQAGVRTHVFRPFSGYGSDQSLDYPFPSFIKRAREHESPFTVWGDGQQSRDFIHIDDIINATLEAINEDIAGPVNLGTGVPTSFDELAHAVARAAGYERPPAIRHILDRPVGVHYRVADVTKLRSFYTPQISLEEGIQRALNDN